MWCLIVAESSIFCIFVVAYLYYAAKSVSGPTPAQVLHVPYFASICLFASSATIMLAERALHRGNIKQFGLLWFLTLALGVTFLAETGIEWQRLIFHEGLTISTNLFGTTYYSLVGLHAFHVTVGLIVIAIVMAFTLLGKVTSKYGERLEVFSLYWHFVDVVWVVVFTVVYV